jgi:hypothetical protein
VESAPSVLPRADNVRCWQPHFPTVEQIVGTKLRGRVWGRALNHEGIINKIVPINTIFVYVMTHGLVQTEVEFFNLSLHFWIKKV